VATHHRDKAGHPAAVKVVSEAREFFRTVGRARLTWSQGEVKPTEGTLGWKARDPKQIPGTESPGAVAFGRVFLRGRSDERTWERKAWDCTIGRQRVSEPAASG